MRKMKTTCYSIFCKCKICDGKYKPITEKFFLLTEQRILQSHRFFLYHFDCENSTFRKKLL